MNSVVSTMVFRPAYRPAATKKTAPANAVAKAQPQFAGTETVLNSTVKETSRVMNSLFGNPGKNMLWSVGYGLGGLLLIPIVPIAVGAFCMAGVHLVSASYQFLHDKPDEAAEKAEIEKADSAKNNKQKSSTQKLSLNA